METRVQKWGNSLAIRIPKIFAVETGLKNNSPVKISLKNTKIIVSTEIKPGFNLKRFLSKINNKNIHHEVNTGPATGEEIW